MARVDVDGYSPPHLSYSTINTYRSCGKKFQLQKVFRLEERPGLASIGGNVVHTMSELYDLGLWTPDVDIANDEGAQ